MVATRNKMLTLKQCKEILQNDAEGLTDEEIIEMRDWLSNMADILIDSLDKIEAEKKNKEQQNEEESNHLHARINGRTEQRI